jgi:hypothetical protein
MRQTTSGAQNPRETKLSYNSSSEGSEDWAFIGPESPKNKTVAAN